ncbi:MAG: Type II secretion system protein F [candidate division BRC1 bacterium ADurb.BinA292]|nr:MAG: Type II secretion system protein F [candidate division BRC1 bacterium ADurb.BinA292]
MAETAEAVERGETIHQAMSRNKAIFSPLVVNIIRVGEVGGMLESSLLRLADIMEAKARIRRKIASASMYPIVALCVALGVITLVLVEAVPRFASIYQESGQTLPKPTQFVINLSNFLVGGWWILLILIVALLLAGRLWTATTAGNRFFSWLALNTPGLSGVNRKIAVARSTRTLGELIAAGFPLTDALLITAQTNENAIVADALRDVHAHVEQGERMTEPLAQARVFPPMVVDMISIGEETGTLDRMLLKIAEIYDAEVETALNGLATIIEPLLIVLMGCVVIFIALAVLLPYFNLVNVVAM